MKKRTIYLTILCLFVLGISQLYANAELEFMESSHDFGTIKEADGPVKHQFNFLNTSEKTVTINSVKAT